jgi:hypothetical protein
MGYNKETDFTSFRTYSWVGRKDLEMSALVHQEIVTAIRAELDAKGLQSVDLEPDLYVSYFADQDEQVRVDIRHKGYSYGSDWYAASGLPLILGGSASEIRVYEEGTLVVDVYNAKSKQLVWRGAAMGTFSQDPKKNRKLVKTATKKLFESYPP